VACPNPRAHAHQANSCACPASVSDRAHGNFALAYPPSASIHYRFVDVEAGELLVALCTYSLVTALGCKALSVFATMTYVLCARERVVGCCATAVAGSQRSARASWWLKLPASLEPCAQRDALPRASGDMAWRLRRPTFAPRLHRMRSLTSAGDDCAHVPCWCGGGSTRARARGWGGSSRPRGAWRARVRRPSPLG